MSPTKYRKKPVVIEAMPFGSTPTDAHSLTSWMEANLYVGLVGNALDPDSLRYPDQIEGDDSTPDKGWYIDPADGALVIRTLEGDMRTAPGDYVIRGVKGEFYPCDPDVFEATYEPATPTPTETTGAVEAAAEAILDACYGQDLPEAPIDLARAALTAALDDVDWPGTIAGHMTITLTDMHRCACHAPLAPSADRYMAEMAHLTHLSAIIRAALLGGAA